MMDRLGHWGRAARRTGLLSACAVALIAVASFGAHAQDKKPAKDQKPAAAAEAEDRVFWVKICDKPEGAEKEICLTQHERFDPLSGNVLVAVALRQVAGEDKSLLLVTVPHSMIIPVGMQIKVDEGEPVKLNYTVCHQAGCVAELPAEPALVEQFKKGTQIEVATIHFQAKKLVFPVPLKGFGDALAGAPVDKAKYVEAHNRMMQAIAQNRAEFVKKVQDKQKAEAEGKKAEEPKKK